MQNAMPPNPMPGYNATSKKYPASRTYTFSVLISSAGGVLVSVSIPAFSTELELDFGS